VQQHQCRSGAGLPIGDCQAADLDQVNLRRGLLITHDRPYFGYADRACARAHQDTSGE
jgi:hypothetical protein